MIYNWIVDAAKAKGMTAREWLREEHDVYALDIDDEFEELMNETSEPLYLCGCSYESGSALKKIDYVAFRQGALNETDSRLSDGDWIEIQDEYYWAYSIEGLEKEGT